MTDTEKMLLDNFCKAVLDMNYGDCFTHQEASKMLGCVHGTSAYRTMISRAKKTLLQRGKAISSLHGYGYEVVKPDEYIAQSARHMKRAANEMSKGQAYADYAPLDEMTTEARQATVAMRDKIAQVASFMRTETCEVIRISRKKSPFEIALERGSRHD